MRKQYGPHFLDADINNDVKNITTFHFPSAKDLNYLVQQGQLSAESIIVKLRELLS